MQSPVAFCSQYLNEVEAKLNDIHSSMGDDPVGRSKVIEALSFIHQARKAVSGTLGRVEKLQQSN